MLACVSVGGTISWIHDDADFPAWSDAVEVLGNASTAKLPTAIQYRYVHLSPELSELSPPRLLIVNSSGRLTGKEAKSSDTWHDSAPQEMCNHVQSRGTLILGYELH